MMLRSIGFLITLRYSGLLRLSTGARKGCDFGCFHMALVTSSNALLSSMRGSTFLRWRFTLRLCRWSGRARFSAARMLFCWFSEILILAIVSLGLESPKSPTMTPPTPKPFFFFSLLLASWIRFFSRFASAFARSSPAWSMTPSPSMRWMKSATSSVSRIVLHFHFIWPCLSACWNQRCAIVTFFIRCLPIGGRLPSYRASSSCV
mmetsp:Transcript_7670/g.19212  ORF Transcript_7670/g.19212 Transcript_7670/m.19212 type:complete len:205 (-) Transcript_7670:546-1160(-)